MKGLKGKVAIITGSSRGIGRATALRLAEEGCKVVINYSKDEKGAKEAQKLCGKDSIVVKADVSKESECLKLIQEAVKKFGKIDILVNNAGAFDSTSLVDVDEDKWEKLMAVNSKSVFFCSKYTSQHMKTGSIINVASYVAFRSRANRTLYASTKSSVAGFTQALAMELAPKIRVNAVAPGVIQTGLASHIVSSPIELKKRLEVIPLSRLGKPEDVANLITFLASDEAGYITGAIVLVDGGISVLAP